ncbi:hypothetical protein O6H91_02G144100 [Diphasiastrum complanatum]|uniref:Uncharacterized protein n=1 Tax=Diphasiastrum complanatum TaxID=34168 RepID=A0ACC2ELA6_DIPCM|nr:hypothetical protein O6H91_02G144100 [Diphasiastrum complanatum]
MAQESLALREQNWADDTLAAHAGLPVSHSSAATKACKGKALWQASVYDFDSVVQSQSASYAYRRFNSPNGDELASAVAALEGAEAGLATSSGMGAIVSAILSVCKSGDILITHSDSYGGTREFFSIDLRAFGIHVIFEDVQNSTLLDSALTQALAPYEKTKTQVRAVVFLESVANPLIRVADVGAAAGVCEKHSALLIVDNTFATPLRSKPLKQGAHIVVHSVSKFLGGHAEVIAGVVVGSRQYVDEASKRAGRWGLTAAPFDAWLALQGVRTLQVQYMCIKGE